MSYLRIKELLKERGITSKEMAEYLDIAEPSLSRITTEKQQPRFELLQQIADRLGVEVWQLFRGSENALEGYVKFKGTLHRIQTKKDLEELLKVME